MLNLPDFATVIGLSAAIFIWRYAIHWRDLVQQENVERYKKVLSEPIYEKHYKNLVGYLLERATVLFNEREFISKAGVNKCLLISFLYSFFVFLFVWAMGGPGSVGTVQVVPEEWSTSYRLLFSVLVIGLSIAIYRLAHLFSNSRTFFLRPLERQAVQFIGPLALLPGVILWTIIIIYLAPAPDAHLILGLFGFLLIGVRWTLLAHAGGAIAGIVGVLLSAVASDYGMRILAAFVIISAVCVAGADATPRIVRIRGQLARQRCTKIARVHRNYGLKFYLYQCSGLSVDLAF